MMTLVTKCSLIALARIVLSRIVTLLFLVPGFCLAQHVYRCERPGQAPQFQESPCESGAQRMVVKDQAIIQREERAKAEKERAEKLEKEAEAIRAEYMGKIAAEKKQAEIQRNERKATCGAKFESMPVLGDNASFVRICSVFGEPKKVNRSVFASGVKEQWVYGYAYLYFENGVLVAIQQ
jgi:hypothetical protein